MRGHDPLVVDEFNGFWSRGDLDACPADHFTDFINFKTIESGYQTRDGLAVAIATSSHVLRFYNYPDASVGDGFLVLLSDNKIYHIYGGISSGIPSFTTFQVSNAITNMTDFAFVSYSGHAYISPSTATNLNGLPGEFVYYYDGGGVNMMRHAAGVAPTNADGALAAANSATAGHVQAGIHVFGVVYETNSGFLTQIGPDTLATVTATGIKSVDLSAIPIFSGGGGTLVIARRIVASVLIQAADYTGNPRDYQLFFVPGGTINNNTATTLTVDFYDSELIEDASHLLDLYSSISACGGLGTYHNRLIGWDGDAGINVVLVSYAGEPEAIDQVDGLLEVPLEGSGITYCQEYRDILYVMKFNRIIAFTDNGDVPTAWPSADIDQGLGCGKHGVSIVGDNGGGTNIEAFLLINEQGIYVFAGTLQTPELSWKIKDYWRSLTILNINVGQIAAYTDPLNQFLYIVIPELSTILAGDYSDGLNHEKIKWQKWTFSNAPTGIALFDKDNKLMIGFNQGIHWIESGQTADTYSGSSAAAIPNPTSISALLPQGQDDSIFHYAAIRAKVVGSGNLRTTIYGLDQVLSSVLNVVAMSTSPGVEPVILCNLLSQRARIQFSTTAINETAKFYRVTLFIKPVYTGYPQ